MVDRTRREGAPIDDRRLRQLGSREPPSAGEIAPAATRDELSRGTGRRCASSAVSSSAGRVLRSRRPWPAPRSLGDGLARGGARGDDLRHRIATAFVAGPLAEGAFTLVAESTIRFESEPVEARTGDTDVVLCLRLAAVTRALVVDSRTGSPARRS